MKACIITEQFCFQKLQCFIFSVLIGNTNTIQDERNNNKIYAIRNSEQNIRFQNFRFCIFIAAVIVTFGQELYSTKL